MITFRNDYSQVAAPEILKKLVEIMKDSFVGYGSDEICDSARAKIAGYLGREDCDIHFLVGGTQTNLTVIDQMLKPWQAVAAVDTGHINVHESAAIEATGHRIEALTPHEGKMSAADLDKLCATHTDEHMIRIGAVYISNSIVSWECCACKRGGGETQKKRTGAGPVRFRQLRKTLHLRTLAIQEASFFRVFRSKLCGKAEFFVVLFPAL